MKPTCLSALLWSLAPGWLSTPLLAATPPAAAWQIAAQAEATSVGLGVPVLALGRADWPAYRTHPADPARALRRLEARVQATDPQGWQFGLVARSQAVLEASADAVTAAALEAGHSPPATPQRLAITARTRSWRGTGLEVGTPWWPLAGASRWQGRAQGTLLQLEDLRLSQADGTIDDMGNGQYGVALDTTRASPHITAPFLTAPGRRGLGAALSLALQGEPAPGWQVRLQADDLWSQLRWSRLTTEHGTLDSQNVSAAPDGSLDYRALNNGTQTLASARERMGARWQAQLRWLPSGQPDGDAGFWRLQQQAGLRQHWLGWEHRTGMAGDWRWSAAVAQHPQALEVGVALDGWHLRWGTDAQGRAGQYRRLQLGWQQAF